MKYIVMECRPGYAVVLDEKGRFIKAANMHYEVGQTVTDIIEIKTEKPIAKNKGKIRWIYSFAATAACFMIVLSSILSAGQTVFASVYLTINPQIKIDVNKKDVVVGIEGMNSDGEILIEDYSFKNKNLELVMDEIVDLAIEKGYLHEAGKIVIDLDAKDKEWVFSHKNSLSNHLEEYLSEKISVTIEVEAEEYIEVIIPDDGNDDDDDDDDDIKDPEDDNSDENDSDDSDDMGYEKDDDDDDDDDDDIEDPEDDEQDDSEEDASENEENDD